MGLSLRSILWFSLCFDPNRTLSHDVVDGHICKVRLWRNFNASCLLPPPHIILSTKLGLPTPSVCHLSPLPSFFCYSTPWCLVTGIQGLSVLELLKNGYVDNSLCRISSLISLSFPGIQHHNKQTCSWRYKPFLWFVLPHGMPADIG